MLCLEISQPSHKWVAVGKEEDKDLRFAKDAIVFTTLSDPACILK
jgi:hypothetical protein